MYDKRNYLLAFSATEGFIGFLHLLNLQNETITASALDPAQLYTICLVCLKICGL